MDETNNFFLKCFLLIKSPCVNFLHIYASCCSDEGRASFYDESSSYLSNLNGPARRTKDGGNTKQGINRGGFARWLLTVEPRARFSLPAISGYSTR